MSERAAAGPGRGEVGELARLFLKLGTVAFGGPAAHIAMMEDEVVRRRGWLTHGEFLDMLGATNLIPGPNSTEMAIHIGYRRAGVAGLVVAGASFILPAALIVTAVAWAYVRFGSVPAGQGVLYGVKPVVIAAIVQALWRLGRVALKTRMLMFVGLAAGVANLMGVKELVVLFTAGAVVPLIQAIGRRRRAGGGTVSALAIPGPLGMTGGAMTVAATGATAAGVTLWPLFLVFLKIGSVLFGSGYVLLAFLRADFVERLHWLTESQLLDATAVGQVTPGPLFTTATFIGYVLAGPAGAAVATLGIFLPAFLFVAISAPLVARLRGSPTAGAVLDGLNVASLALMAVVTLELGRAAVHDWFTALLAGMSAVLLVRYRVNVTWLVLGGAIVGGLTMWAQRPS